MTAVTVDFAEVLEVFAEAQERVEAPIAALASGLHADTDGVGVVAVREWARLHPQRMREARRAQDKRRRSKPEYREANRAASARYREAHRQEIAAKERAKRAAAKAA